MSIARDTAGKHSTDLFTNEAIKLIEAHDTRNPMFMYLAHMAPHAASFNGVEALQVSAKELEKFSYIRNANRKSYAGNVKTFKLYGRITLLNEPLVIQFKQLLT